MSKESIGSRSESRPEWEHLEDWVQGQVQRLIQDLLEQEVTEFLGRDRSVRRADSDSDTGYRNGYAPPRKLTLSSGTIHLRRPRVRHTEERFESRLLPLFVHRTRKVADLISDLYLHGLSEGDFDLALRGLLGEEAPVSASTVARLKERWNAELAQWRTRPLDDLEVVYMWVDGVYVKAGFEKDKAAVLVVIAALSDGKKVVVSAVPGYRESTQSWSDVLRDLRDRGLSCPRLVVGDGHLGIWGALGNVYPQAAEKRCWNHKIINVLDRLPKRQQGQARPGSCCGTFYTRRPGRRPSASGRCSPVGDATTPTRRRLRPLSGTRTAWSPSTTSPKSTGDTFGRLTPWSRPSPLSDSGPMPPNATRG